MKRFVIFCLTVVFVILVSSCSVYMAAKQPEKKNLDVVLAKGSPRDHVIAELGKPVSSVKNDKGERIDLYKFVQGYSTGAKVGRAVWHATADVFTLGLWEVIGTPTEAVFSGDEMAYEVTYDKNDNIAKVSELKASKPEAATEAKQEIKPEAVTEAKQEREPETVKEAIMEAKQDTKPEATPDTKSGGKPEVRTEAEQKSAQ